MNLFGIDESLLGVATKKKPNITLKKLITDRYDNDEVIKALLDYLTGRRQMKCYPSIVALEKQLDILDSSFSNDKDKINQINTATMRGWRQLVYEQVSPCSSTVTRTKQVSNQIEEEF